MDDKGKRIISQGTFPKNCDHCGRPMIVAKGRVIEMLNKDGIVIYKEQNNDQRAIYHKKCRTEGRRLNYKAQKREKVLNK